MNVFGFGLDRRLIGALVAVATLMFLVAVTPGFRYRRAARRAAIATYALVFAGVAAWATLWFFGVGV